MFMLWVCCRENCLGSLCYTENVEVRLCHWGRKVCSFCYIGNQRLLQSYFIIIPKALGCMGKSCTNRESSGLIEIWRQIDYKKWQTSRSVLLSRNTSRHCVVIFWRMSCWSNMLTQYSFKLNREHFLFLNLLFKVEIIHNRWVKLFFAPQLSRGTWWTFHSYKHVHLTFHLKIMRIVIEPVFF